MTIKQLIESKQANDALEILKNVTLNSPFEGKLYMAGGYVRDTLLGKNSKDIDFVVEGGPESGLEAATYIAKKLGVYKENSNPVIFPLYYTAKLQINTPSGPMDIEFVAPRKEKYTPGSRKPGVSAGSLIDDVMRRDFTCNSLLQNLHSNKILDLSGRGKHDLEAGILNTTGPANEIFAEDPLRILRAIRFCIKYDFKLPLNVIKSIKKAAPTLDNISIERINDEIGKILLLKNPSKAFKLFKITGILEIIMPELKALDKLSQNAFHNKDAFGHTLDVLDKSSPKLIIRLAALMHDIGKAICRTEIGGKIQFLNHAKIGAEITKNLLKRLKYPNDVISKVANIVEYHMDLKSAGDDATALKDSTLRAFIYKVGSNLEELLDLMHADNLSHAPGKELPNQINNIRKRIQNMDIEDILKTKSILSGNEIHELGANGKLIGIIKDRILDKCVRNPKFSRHEAINLATNMIRDHKSTER